MEIASYNVNGIRARLPRLIDWIKSSMPDVIVLQEIKSRLEHFPTEEIESLGYNIELAGQKSFNGVAVFSKFPIEGLNSGSTYYAIVIDYNYIKLANSKLEAESNISIDFTDFSKCCHSWLGYTLTGH